MTTARTLWAYLFSSTTFSKGDVCGSLSMCDGPHAGFPRRARCQRRRGSGRTPRRRQVELPRLARPKGCFDTSADSPPNGASRAVGTHHGPTRIHVADYSRRHWRDGNAGTTILYHPRNRRRPHSSSGMTAGRRELLEDGHHRYFRRGRRTFQGTTGQTEQRAD